MFTCPPIVFKARRDALNGPPIAASTTVLVAKRSGIESNSPSTKVLDGESARSYDKTRFALPRCLRVDAEAFAEWYKHVVDISDYQHLRLVQARLSSDS